MSFSAGLDTPSPGEWPDKSLQAGVDYILGSIGTVFTLHVLDTLMDPIMEHSLNLVPENEPKAFCFTVVKINSNIILVTPPPPPLWGHWD